MSDFDSRMGQLLDDAVPQPPRTLNPESIRAGRSTDRRSPLRTVLAVAAAVLVVAGVVAVVIATRGPDRKPAAAAPQTSTAPEPRGNSPRAVTVRAVDRLLRAAPALPGSVSSAGPPSAVLRNGMSTPASPNLIRRIEWSTVPGSVHDALAYFAAHVPSGIRPAGSGRYTDHGVTKVYSRSYHAVGSGWRHAGTYTGLELSIVAGQLGDHVGVGIYADAIWLPPRPSNSYVPPDVTGATVVIVREGVARTVHRHLDKSDARRLARIVNGLSVPAPGVRSCPMALVGRQEDIVRFAHSTHTTVTVTATGCREVDVTVGGKQKARLNDYLKRTDVNAIVLKMIGLPPGYGQQ